MGWSCGHQTRFAAPPSFSDGIAPNADDCRYSGCRIPRHLGLTCEVADMEQHIGCIYEVRCS